VAFPRVDTFKHRLADTTEHRRVVERALRGLTGAPLQIRFELRDLEPAGGGAAEEAPPSEDEWVARFKSEFDAEEIVPDPDDSKEGEA
ncbi:MAG TPA: hypothetical protein VHF51_17040, partial [Solirubrobacteraceae bacterium]|nr:hypothetical protein [Solirubrobacteraceae bacterium]